jgi:hypothetical protein
MRDIFPHVRHAYGEYAMAMNCQRGCEDKECSIDWASLRVSLWTINNRSIICAVRHFGRPLSSGSKWAHLEYRRGGIEMSPTPSSPASVDDVQLLRAVKRFQRESLTGVYYAPFNMNSKNYRDIPKETERWFQRLANLLRASTQLTRQKEHAQAVACFRILYGLIHAMENGEEIVFAEELGSWMIPGDEKKFIAAYLKSLAKVATPEEFAQIAIPLIRRDSHISFSIRCIALRGEWRLNPNAHYYKVRLSDWA